MDSRVQEIDTKILELKAKLSDTYVQLERISQMTTQLQNKKQSLIHAVAMEQQKLQELTQKDPKASEVPQPETVKEPEGKGSAVVDESKPKNVEPPKEEAEDGQAA